MYILYIIFLVCQGFLLKFQRFLILFFCITIKMIKNKWLKIHVFNLLIKFIYIYECIYCQYKFKDIGGGSAKKSKN